MLELGPYERQGHEMIGLRAAQVADLLITYGSRAHLYAQAARQAGMPPSDILEFETGEPIIEWLTRHLSAHDTVLLKGSHGLHMESITAALEMHR
jgi:UDP-N-acetylmuramoyl-tripeptide--D-alanyl-D-alanine ligase